MQKLGLVLITLSFTPWVIIPFILPFLPLSLAQKALLIPILLMVGEVIFWLGLFIVGKDVVQRYKRFLNLRYFQRRLKRFLLRRKRRKY